MAESNGDDGAPGYLSIMDSTQEVLPGIWLGGVVVAEDKARLTALNVSHILTLGPYMDPCFPDDWVYHVVDGILDMPARNILCYLPECVAFLETATTDGTGVYIHCQAGTLPCAGAREGGSPFFGVLAHPHSLLRTPPPFFLTPGPS